MRSLGKLVDLAMLGVSVWMLLEAIQSMSPEDVRKARKLKRQQDYIGFCRDMALYFGTQALKAEKKYYEMVQS